MSVSLKGSDLVSHIAGFTSLRDTDLLELSLLKSVYTSLRPIKVSLIVLDTNDIILKRVDYSKDEFGHITTRVGADPALLNAVEQLDKSNREYCTVEQTYSSISLFLLSLNRRISHYVCVEAAPNAVTQSDSHQIIGMLRVFQNFRELLTESQTDELTGLPNRKSFNGFVSKINDALMPTPEVHGDERRHSANQAETFWLALVDLDNFKQINDTFGHLMGDEVLVRAAQVMQGRLREFDMVFRYGGEEFAILAPAENKEDITALLERVREAIQALNLSTVGNITASFGVVEMRRDTFHITSIENADKALYHSKENGKNQITFASDIELASNDATDDDIELF